MNNTQKKKKKKKAQKKASIDEKRAQAGKSIYCPLCTVQYIHTFLSFFLPTLLQKHSKPPRPTHPIAIGIPTIKNPNNKTPHISSRDNRTLILPHEDGLCISDVPHMCPGASEMDNEHATFPFKLMLVVTRYLFGESVHPPLRDEDSLFFLAVLVLLDHAQQTVLIAMLFVGPMTFPERFEEFFDAWMGPEDHHAGVERETVFFVAKG